MNTLASEFDIIIPAPSHRYWIWIAAGSVVIVALVEIVVWRSRRNRI